ncbi:MAG: glutamine--fructose-6-phosphate aminotransferase, partial [Acidobacteriota bacterium]|nr:glutamine--fructose-6-phosphate aminotransferase [Acidobacteriota bacterium]
MCGIAGFVSNQSWQRDAHLLPLEQIAGDLAVAAGAETDWALACDALDRLADGFDALQSFGLFAEVVRSPDTAQRLRSVAESLRVLSERATRRTAEEGADADLRALVEKLNDYVWQVQVEVLDFVGQVERVMPRPVSETGRPELFVAWSIARVLSAVDRLEVRGRDSLGVSIVLRLQAPVSVPVPLREEFERRCRADETVSGGMTVTDGDAVALRVVYKVANLVGSLGENTETIRSTLRDDVLLWRAAAEMQGLNIVAHTRWASNGIINESNCHPVDGTVESARGSGTEGSDRVLFTLNGDVDNYADLVDSFVAARGKRINPAVSTDAKILPVLYSLGTER